MRPFRRHALCALLLFGTLRMDVILVAQTPSASPQPRFPGEVELVTVDVVVLEKGQPVRGLTRDDFVVLEDDRRQAIATFEAVDIPEAAPAAAAAPLMRSRVSTNLGPPAPPGRSFAIVFDNVHLSPTQADRAKTAVADFLQTGLREGDRMQLVATGGGAWWSARMSAGKADLLAALERVRGLRLRGTGPDQLSDFEALQIYVHRDKRIGAEVMRRWAENGVFPELWSGGGASRGLFADMKEGHPLLRAKAAQVYKDVIVRQRATTNALERVLEGLATSRGRKTVLMISEGFIHDPQEGSFAQVREAARRANAVIYFMDARLPQGSESSEAELGRAIDIRDLGTTLSRQQQDVTGAVSVAVDSGGERFGTVAALADNLRQLADQSRAYYLLGYPPTSTMRDGRFRSIKVEVKRPGLEVRARRGYTPPKKGRAARDAAALDPDVQRALDSPFATQGIPLRLASYVLGPAPQGRTRTVLVAEADVRGLRFTRKDGRHHDLLEAFFVVTSRDTGQNQNYQSRLDLSLPAGMLAQLQKTGVPLQRAFDLPPGVYQARLAVRERNGGLVGTVAHEFEVEEPDRLRVTTPVITDAMVPSEGGGPPRPLALARRTFARGTRLVVQFEVYGAARDAATGQPRVSAGYTLRRADGVALSGAEPTALAASPQGALGRMMMVELPPTTSGAHELVLTVRDDVSGARVELQEPFLVEGPPASEPLRP